MFSLMEPCVNNLAEIEARSDHSPTMIFDGRKYYKALYLHVRTQAKAKLSQPNFSLIGAVYPTGTVD